jgi:heme-degrading monooxygenase HmoA
MIAVIFEVVPQEGRKEEYLTYAARLRPALEKLDGLPAARGRRAA